MNTRCFKRIPLLAGLVAIYFAVVCQCLSATISFGNYLDSFEKPTCPLEKRLFLDAADGQLDEFSPFEAALIAGGIDNPDCLRRYREKAASLADEARRSVHLDADPRELAKQVFEFMHDRALAGGYDLAYTDLRRVLDDGRYNCLSATVLFNFLAAESGLESDAVEMPGHAMSRVSLADGYMDVETTCPEWFTLKSDVERREAVSSGKIGTPGPVDASKTREVSPIHMTAMIYYNRGVDFLNAKNFAESAAANAKAMRLYPANAVAQKNLLATLNNWSIELGNAGRFSEAVEMLRRGLEIDPTFAAFSQNYVHVHRQWSDRLCSERRFEQAAEILSQALVEMPDREGLKNADDELRRRWAKAALDDAHVSVTSD